MMLEFTKHEQLRPQLIQQLLVLIMSIKRYTIKIRATDESGLNAFATIRGNYSIKRRLIYGFATIYDGRTLSLGSPIDYVSAATPTLKARKLFTIDIQMVLEEPRSLENSTSYIFTWFFDIRKCTYRCLDENPDTMAYRWRRWRRLIFKIPFVKSS